jgi:hypothetical protein
MQKHKKLVMEVNNGDPKGLFNLRTMAPNIIEGPLEKGFPTVNYKVFWANG